MKIIGFLSFTLALLVTQNLFAAANQIDFVNARLVKSLKKSVEQPINLYKSTAPGLAHANHLFTARVLGRLEDGGLPTYDQTAIRNEICASSAIQTAQAANPYDLTPAAIGVYKLNESVVAVQDQGLMGERLDSVLRKLSVAEANVKTRIAAEYGREMKRLLNIIHVADVIWNNASLSNFYVRPDGRLTAIDFSSAQRNPGGLDTPEKIRERRNFLAGPVQNMYEILFPKTGEANAGDAYANFVAGLAVGAGWLATNWNIATFGADGAGLFAAAASPPTGYIPGVDSELGAVAGIARAEHRPNPMAPPPVDAANMGGATGFVLDAQVLPFVTAGAGAPPWLNMTTMCAAW